MLEDFSRSWQSFKLWCLKNRTSILTIFIVTLLIKIIYWLNHQNFSQDGVRDYLFIKNIVDSGRVLIKLGPTTSVATNFSLPPLYYYFYLLAHLIGRGYFYSMDLLVIFFESFTPIVLFYLLSKCTSKRKLIIALCGLYAISPHVIIFSNSAWNPSLMPLFSSLLILGACKFLIQKSYSGLVLALLSFFILVNLHFSSFVFVPIILVCIFFSLFNKKTYPYIVLSLAIILILSLPYIIGEINSQFSNTIGILSFVKNGSATAQYDRLTFFKFWIFFFPGFFGRIFSHELLLGDWASIYNNFSINIWWIITITFFSALSVLAAICAGQQIFQKKILDKSERFYPSVLIGIFLSMAFTLRLYKGDKPDYFLLVFNIFIFIFLALAFNVLNKYFKKKKQNIVICTVLILLGLLELLAFWKLTNSFSNNAYMDYQKFFRFVTKYSNSKIVVIPMNQELVVPLTYYFNSEQIQKKPDINAKQNLLVCFHSCINYQANACHNNNIAKYDLVNFTDFSAYFPYYDFSDPNSKIIFKNKTIEAVLINQKLPD